MQENSAVEVGNFQIAVTPHLREMFAHTHAAMSGKDSTAPQYPLDEQYEMYLLCEVTVPGDRTLIDPWKTEDNLLELLHYLNSCGVAIPQVAPRVRCHSTRTKGVAMRLHLQEVRQSHAIQAVTPLFLGAVPV